VSYFSVNALLAAYWLTNANYKETKDTTIQKGKKTSIQNKNGYAKEKGYDLCLHFIQFAFRKG